MDSDSITIRSEISFHAGTGSSSVEVVSEWRHPGIRSLSLRALCVEISARSTKPWVMPKTIKEVCDKLLLVEVYRTEDLRQKLLLLCDVRMNEELQRVCPFRSIKRRRTS
jgi:hypothetical protein